ncbi:MAG: restriction endonuclease subunit S, partial [Desulfobulbaceae bacterium]|nr:restriction endonuclease subunit S [Desulfobulbaceae bacterium]
MRWPRCPISSAPVEIIDGDRGKEYPKQADFQESGYCLFLNTGNVRQDGFDFSNCQFVSEDKDRRLRKGKLTREDLVMTTRGTIGNVAYFDENVTYDQIRINSGMVVFRTDRKRLLPSFLYHFFRSPDFVGQTNSLRSGAAQPQLPIRDIKQIELPLPDVPTQQRISSILSTYDDLIEINRRRMALLEDAARQVYQEWFVCLRFPGYEHTRIVDGVPEGWDRVPLESALVLQRGFDLPSQSRQEGTVPIYASTGVNGYHNTAKVRAPGIVTGRSGSLGMVHYVHEDFWPLNTSLWVKEFRLVTPVFAYFLLSSLRLDQYNGGVSVPTLDRKVVHKIEVVVPNVKIQALFGEYVLPMFSQVRQLGLYNDKLRTARDLLLPKLMSGEIS